MGPDRLFRPAWRRRAAAVVCGAAMGTSWQPVGCWPLAFLGVTGLVLLVTTGRAPLRLRAAAATGWCFGLGMGAVALGWVHVIGWYVVPPLIAFMALWQALTAVVVHTAWRLTANPFLRALLAASGWSLAEYGASRVPFGGFGWLRLAWTQVDSPTRGWLPLVGAAGLSLVVALTGSLLAVILQRTTSRAARTVAAALAALLFAAAPLAGRVPAGAPGREVTVGIVQGNVDGSAGPHAMGYARSVTVNHVSATIDLMARVRSGMLRRPDFVLWPENSTDIDPRLDETTRDLVAVASRVVDRPILVGAVSRGPGPDERQTTALWWPTDQVPTARYDKRNLVPFGEWIPLRRQLLPVLPVLEQVGAQSVPGTTPGVLDVRLADGTPLVVGDVICFELAWDSTVRDTVTHGAQLLVVQSNNGTYTGTGQPRQQFAITRARAMELRREIAVSTTNSLSGLVHPDGSVTDGTREATAATRSVTVPVRSGLTPAVSVGPVLEAAGAALAVLVLLGGCWASGGHRHPARREVVRHG